MSRMKAFFAILLVAMMMAFVLHASATTDKVRVAIAGSSGTWQTIGLAADNYNGTKGLCASVGVTVHPPCNHYTDFAPTGSTAKFNLNDTRPTLNGLGGNVNQDAGDLWIVWDSPTGTQVRNVWVYLKVDSIVGVRCFYANPKCTITEPSGFGWTLNPKGSAISPALWGNDITPPADVQALFTGNGVTINTAASDIRPEDAAFEACRVNSALGNGAPGFGDGLDGLGYGTIASGTCPQFGAPLSELVGFPIKSGVSGATANPLAFNLSGHDPFTNNLITTPNVYDIGAYPIVFVFSRSTTVNAGLKGATDISSSAAQTVFSGANCDAHVIDPSIAAGTGINVYLREPLSGTMTTTEMSVFRRPVETVPTQKVLGVSQEANVGGNAGHNPLDTACVSGTGTRIRGIGTGEVVAGVQNSGGGAPDGIAYAFNGFGNFSHIAGSASYGYLTLDGVDPIGPYVGEVNQELPTCTVPCTEAQIWGSDGSSFPALRAGNYSAWSLIHLISSLSTQVKDLIVTSNAYTTGSAPDYIPALAVTGANPDPGMQIWHTHYQQRDGNDNKIGASPTNGTFTAGHNPNGGDKGGDAGGCTISTVGITSTTKIDFIQTGPGTMCSSSRLRD
jgi:hypothetical protein